MRHKTFRHRKIMYKTTGALIGIALLCCLSGSCGYKVGFKAKREIRSIAVPIFRNRTLRRGFEFTLADALRREILQRTHLRLSDPDEADAMLQGEILTVNEGVLLEGDLDEIVDSSITVRIKVSLEDLRKKDTVFKDRLLTETAEFVLPRGESKESATREALGDLAERIVFLLEEDW
jgi:hypothetical protein